MPSFAFHPPVHLKLHPEEPVRDIEAARKVVERHAPDLDDPETRMILGVLDEVHDPEAADIAGRTFAQWAEHQGLLLARPAELNP